MALEACAIHSGVCDTWLITQGHETSEMLSFQPTVLGFPPMMLKPRDPPSRRRRTVKLLVSSSYRHKQTQTDSGETYEQSAERKISIQNCSSLQESNTVAQLF